MGVMDRYNKKRKDSSENDTQKLGVQERYELNRLAGGTDGGESRVEATANPKGIEGWQKYLDDMAKSDQEEAEARKDETFWEKIGRYLGTTGATDTSIPLGNVPQITHDLREDTSYKTPNNDWSEEQQYAFGELYLESPTLAYDYAEKINIQNKKAKEEESIKDIQDSATSSFGAGVGHTLGAIASAPLGMADFLDYLVKANAGRDPLESDGLVSPFEYSQAVTEGVGTHLNEEYGTLDESIPIIGGKGWGDVYGLGTSIAQSAVSGATLGPGGTLISYFGQGAASGMKEALSRGATEGQAAIYGIALGAFEGIAESIGVDRLFKIGSSSTLKEMLKNVLRQAGAEGIEEGLTSILGNIADNVIMQDQSNFYAMVEMYKSQGMSEEEAKKKAWMDSVEGIAFDTIAGAVSGGVHGGVATSIQTGISNHNASKLYGNQSQMLVDDALGSQFSDVKAVGQKYQDKLDSGKKLSGWNLNELIDVTDNSKLKSAVLQRLGELGETSDVTAVADVLVRQAMGEELSSKDINILNNSKAGHTVLAEMNADNIKSGGLDNKWAENIGTRRINPEAYNKPLYDLAKNVSGMREAEEQDSVAKTLAESETATGAKIEASDDGRTIYTDAEGNASAVNVNRIVSTKGGVKVELDNGNTVSAKDLRFGTREEGLMYEMVARMEATPETANELISTFKPNNIKQATMYFTAVPLAYQYGKMGYEAGLKNISLSEAEKRIAFNRGRADAIEADKAKTKTATKKGTETASTKKGGIIFEDGFVYDEASANELQKASMAGIEVMDKMSNLEFHVFRSRVVDGKRVAYINGKLVSAPNGYFTDGNKIYIDFEAGNGGEGAMLYTMSHEVTHYIRQWNAKGFRELGDFLIAEYGKQGVPVNALLEAQKDKIKKRYKEEGKTLPSEAKLADMAYEELVADAMSDMFTDPKAYEKLAKLKKKNLKLWQKLGDAIKALLDKLKTALGIYKTKDAPVAKEAMFVRGFSVDVYEKLQDLYIKAFVEADANYASAEKTLYDSGISVDSKTESASLMSVRDVLDDKQRQEVSKALATRFGVTQKEALQWLTAETSLASLILNPKYSQYLDYTADASEEAIKSNSDYPQGTVDFSNICKKRRDFTEVMNRVLRNFPNHVFEATDLAKIRTIMMEEGMEVACGICYVEDRRQLDSVVAQDFINSLELYRKGSKTRPDGKPFNANQLKALKLIDGDSYTPSIYELISLEGRNILKTKNPAMEEAWVKFNNARGMQSVRLLLNDAEYKRQILKYTPAVVKRKNDLGGLRIYSFSDAEMFHLIDIIQVITDSATVGLSIQGYTKVNEYAKAVKDTGEKLNRSLIPKGDLGYHMEDGKVVLDFDTVEGIDINHPDFFDNIDNPNVGNILIGINKTQIKAAMVSKFVDQIIPFHTGQSNEVLGEKGISAWDNYKDFQSERDIATGKKSTHQINIYTEVIQAAEKEGKPITNKVEFVNKFLEVCKENNLEPRFSEFLNVDENGNYTYAEGYHKFLVDFKTFDQNTGEYLPQMPVKPFFDNEYITKLLKDYVKSQKAKDAELAKAMPKVLDRITNEIVNSNDGQMLFSVREEYASEIDEWSKEGMPDGETFVLGTTGDILQGLGAIENDIYLQGDKIKEILSAHPEMTLDEIKKIPQILENPILILKSRNVGRNNRQNTRVVIFGSVKAKNGLPILSVMDLRPTENHIVIDDMQKVTSAYTKTNNPVEFIRNSDVLYAEKKKTTSLLRTIGFQMPIELNKSGFVGSISYSGQNVNILGEKFSDVFSEGSSDGDEMHSDRDSYAPTFYSHMGKVIDGIKTDKIGANGVVPYLKGKGVKDEEIKWSGIEAFLEGKKSVTKKELQEFVAGSQLRIEEEMSGYNKEVYDELDALWRQHMGVSLSETFSDDFDLPLTADNMADVFDDAERDGYDVPTYEVQHQMLNLARRAGNEGRWSKYKLAGGTNYRELVFKMPNSSYSNNAMRVHWGEDAEGVLAHARIQDMTTADGKNMLFIEEIQSDWHNEGRDVGYAKKLSSKEEKRVAEIEDQFSIIRRERTWIYAEMRKYVLGGDKYNALKEKLEPLTEQLRELQDELDEIQGIDLGSDVIPDAPFRNNYHEYVLKRLLRMAAEEGYDSLGWTTADIQSERWSDNYAEGYRIEYDQDIPKFLRKYGKKWGATVEHTYLDDLKYNPDYDEMVDLFRDGVTPKGTKVWSMDITDSMTESVLYEGQVMYSDRVTGQETLDFLENQEHITTYKSFVEIDGKLYSPMATKVKGDDGKYHLTNPSEIGVWQQAEEKPESIPKFHKTKGYGYYVLKKDDGGSVTAAYNPYEHSSNLVLNDQFESAYQRPNLVTVECIIPKSEMTSGYKAKYAKDSTGYLDWKSGTVAGKLKGNKRKVYLSRWLKPVRILSDAEVASMYKDILGSKISVPFNVVTPQLRTELEKVGVKIDYEGSPGYQYRQSKKATDTDTKYSERDPDAVSNRTILANALESIAQNDIEKNKLAQYKAKIALIESEQAKLNEIRAEANELRFKKGRSEAETKRLRDLDFEATQTANRINTYDKQLLNLESTSALKGVLEREKTLLRKRLEKKGKDALRAYKEKNAATVRELMTRHTESRKKAIESRHKTEMRHKIKNVVSDLNKLLLNPTKDQHVPIGLQGVVADALDAINMDTMNAEERVAYYNNLISKSTDPDEIKMLKKKRDFFEYRDMSFKARITALKNAYAEFKESDDPLIRNAHNDAIEDLIRNTADAVGNKSLKDMSYAQLEAVYDMYKAILATVRNSNKMFKEGRQATVTENSESVKTEVKEAGGHKDRVLKVFKFIKKFGWGMLKPVTAMKVVGSKTFAKLFDNVRAGEDTWAVDVAEAKQFYEAISDKYGYKKWDFKQRYTFKDSMGNDFSLSLEQIMSLYAYSKREQADKHLEFGGFIFDDAIEVTEKKLGIPLKYEVNDANPYRLRKEDLLPVMEALTAEQKGFIDEMQTYLSDVMGAKGNEVSLALYDIKLYKEKNYFPLKTARYFREFDPEKSGTPKIKNSGFSKKTVPQAGNPIVLSNFMDVWASHVNDMSMYHAFVLPLEDFMRVYNYSSTAGGYDSVQQYIKNAYGSQANQYIERLMDDLNGGARVDASADVINKGISLFKKASVFASASVVVQQPSAIARAFAYINPKYFATSAGSALNLVKHKSVWAEIKKYAPVAVIKEMGYFDTGMGRSTVEWIKGNQTIKDKMDDVLAKAPAMADELSWSYIWLAVKNEIKSTTSLTPGSEEFLGRVGKRFTEVITNTQVYDSVLARSGMMRSKDTGMKMATAFMAEPTTTVNMMVDGIIQGKRGNKKFTASTVGAVSASIILNSILVALVYAARDDDEDETYAEKYIGSLTTELLDGFNPLTYIPFVKDVWSIAQGYDVERSDMSVISNLWESIEGLFNEDKSGWEKVADATGAVSSLFGIPLKNIIRDAKGMYNLTKTLTSGTPTTGAGIEDAIKDSFTSSVPLWDRLHESDSNADRLYKAIVSGDQNQIDRIKSRFDDEKAIESAMKQGLRENDSRIHEAAQARLDGNLSEYTRIAREIIAEGHFSQDTVVGAINSEMSAIKRGESTETEPAGDKDEATSIYKASDINVAFDNGDTATALEIIDDLIETKVANGKTEKEAKSSLRSSMTSYWKPLYKEAYQSGDTSEMARIRQILFASGLYGSGNDVVKAVYSWLKD